MIIYPDQGGAKTILKIIVFDKLKFAEIPINPEYVGIRSRLFISQFTMITTFYRGNATASSYKPLITDRKSEMHSLSSCRRVLMNMTRSCWLIPTTGERCRWQYSLFLRNLISPARRSFLFALTKEAEWDPAKDISRSMPGEQPLRAALP